MLKGALDEAKKTLEEQKKKAGEEAKKEKEKKKKEDRGKAKEEKEEPTINEQVHLLDCLNELYQFGVKKDVFYRGVTIIPAQLLWVDNLVGSLEKGKKADMIVLKNDPLENTPSIEKVILGGRFVR